MNPFDLLNTGLLDLLYELRDADMPLVVGGGYGLYLKQNYVRANQLRTLFDLYPQSRSTSKTYQNDPAFKDAADIVNQHFSHLEARGTLRIREHPDFFDGMDLKEFMAVLAEVFKPQLGRADR